MKKLLLVLFLFIGYNAYSQNYDENGYQEVNVKASTALTVSVSGRVNVIDTTDFSVFRKSNRDSVGSSPDTLSRLPGNFFLTAVVDTADNMTELGITKWYSLIIAPADTIVLSTSATFTNGEYWIIYPNESWTSEKFNKFYTGNYYWKSLFTGGHTGTALVRWRYWGF